MAKKRNYLTTPLPKGFKYVRQPLHMPVAMEGIVRRGRIVGKNEEGFKKANQALLDHQLGKFDDFPLVGRDKKLATKLEPKKPITPKQPASTIDMKWIKEQKDKIKNALSSVDKAEEQDPYSVGTKHHIDFHHPRISELDGHIVENLKHKQNSGGGLVEILGTKGDIRFVAGKKDDPSPIRVHKDALRPLKKSEEPDVAGLLWLFNTDEGKAQLDSLLRHGAAIETVNECLKSHQEFLAGGLADGKQKEDFDPEELKLGIKIEMEHTDDPKIAEEIAKDHLMELPDYYTRLKAMEDKAKKD